MMASSDVRDTNEEDISESEDWVKDCVAGDVVTGVDSSLQ
jgi:hypothetical protein